MSKRKAGRDDDDYRIVLFTIDSSEPMEIPLSKLKTVAPQFIDVQTERQTFYLPVTRVALNAFLESDENVTADDTKLWLEVLLLKNIFKSS